MQDVSQRPLIALTILVVLAIGTTQLNFHGVKECVSPLALALLATFLADKRAKCFQVSILLQTFLCVVLFDLELLLGSFRVLLEPPPVFGLLGRKILSTVLDINILDTGTVLHLFVVTVVGAVVFSLHAKVGVSDDASCGRRVIRLQVFVRSEALQHRERVQISDHRLANLVFLRQAHSVQSCLVNSLKHSDDGLLVLQIQVNRRLRLLCLCLCVLPRA